MILFNMAPTGIQRWGIARDCGVNLNPKPLLEMEVKAQGEAGGVTAQPQQGGS